MDKIGSEQTTECTFCNKLKPCMFLSLPKDSLATYWICYDCEQEITQMYERNYEAYIKDKSESSRPHRSVTSGKLLRAI